MRRLSVALLLAVVVVLGAAGLGTAARLGVFQAGTPPAGDSSLDPAALGGGGAAQRLPVGVCPPLPEPPGASGSDLELGGACAFHQAGTVYCQAAGDDFYALLRRELPGGRTLSLYLDVEFYSGPRSYDRAQALLLIQDGTTIYTWSNFRIRATVTAGEKQVRLQATELLPEAGRGGEGIENLNGSLGCGAPRPD